MADQVQTNAVDLALDRLYGASLMDLDGAIDAVEQALDDGEDPEAIAEWIGEKCGLEKISDAWKRPSLN